MSMLPIGPNHTDLSIAANQEAYHRISIAKRRLVACVITLGLSGFAQLKLSVSCRVKTEK